MTYGNHERKEDVQAGGRSRYLVRRIFIITIILLVGIFAARYLILTKPKASRKPPERIAPLVAVVPLHPAAEVIRIAAMGTVVPAREVGLKAPVGGEIKSIDSHFIPGGLPQEGSVILQIDPRDYELALQQKERALADAEFALKLEEGRQDVARQEWELLQGGSGGQGPEADLALRRPHLEKVQADLRAARAELDLARLNLSRTVVKAPFNSQVLKRYVDKGSFVAPQEKLADLVGTDEYWVQVSLPLDRLQWVKRPEEGKDDGSPARILYRQGNVREGRVIRLLGDLAREGRMARLLVSVSDPLGLRDDTGMAQPVLIGEYVRVDIEGERLEGVYSIPRTALRNDREIWIVTAEEKLAVRRVETIWRDESHVFIKDGIQPGELLVVSNLAVPVDGMDLRIDSEKLPADGSAGDGAEGAR